MCMHMFMFMCMHLYVYISLENHSSILKLYQVSQLNRSYHTLKNCVPYFLIQNLRSVYRALQNTSEVKGSSGLRIKCYLILNTLKVNFQNTIAGRTLNNFELQLSA